MHRDSLGAQTADRLALYRNVVGGHTNEAVLTLGRATGLLANAVARQAAILSYIDVFLAAAALFCLFLTAFLRTR